MKLLTARYVVPVTSPVIEDGGLLIDAGRILQIGPAAQLRKQVDANATIEDLGDAALLPGFINAHTHLELTQFQGQVPRAGLWDWFDALLPKLIASSATETLQASIRDGAAMSLAAGVTTVADISRRGLTAAALAGSPIRRICFVELISGASQPPATPEELASVVSEQTAAFADERTHIGVTPHAPYTVTPDHLCRATELASQHNLPLTMHLLETPEERDWLEGRTGQLADFLRDRGFVCADHQPNSLREYLDQSRLLKAAPLLAHMNYADDDTIDSLMTSASGIPASVVFCPRAHAYFGHENHPWQRLMARGLNVCVGTDSLASNDSLSILDELRFLASRFPEVAPQSLLEMGTINAARALGMEQVAGQLTPGAHADCFAIRIGSPNANTIVEELIGGAATPFQTWVAGETAHTQVP